MPNASQALGTCVGAREGAEEPGVLAVAVMHLHHVVEGRVEEGELSKHHCGGDTVWRPQHGMLAAILGARTGGVGTAGQEKGSPGVSCWFLGLTAC